MRKHPRSFRHHESGSVAVEFAFIFPVLLMFLLGVMEWGRYMYVYNTLQFGCEQAVRWGVYNITGPATDIENYAKSQMVGVNPDVTATIDAGANSVEVNASTQFNFVSDLVSPFPSITITARARM
ncbi:TadE/TadG family type IV pilus assembly protein [Dongia sp.]|uniref:TadE/TadG family type IV pilus assembly protein n=1 Tax=Dongia sp. TaxID=1977262 RepID=UPI0035B4DCEC